MACLTPFGRDYDSKSNCTLSPRQRGFSYDRSSGYPYLARPSTTKNVLPVLARYFLTAKGEINCGEGGEPVPQEDCLAVSRLVRRAPEARSCQRRDRGYPRWSFGPRHLDFWEGRRHVGRFQERVRHVQVF